MIAKSWFSRCWQWQIGGCVAILGALSVGVSDRVLAQIVPDNTLGAEGSVVTPDVNIHGISSDRIDGGATRGANLFHSFQEFNVGEGRGAYFANPTGIENILTRVTGSNASNIFGRLGVLGEANLFLLNPNGIVFGPNASLDIQGSFVATTAERIQLGDSGYFSAAQPQTSSLLSVSPGALFFSEVANQPGSIINRGNLSTGKHLTLSAGNLDLQGQLLSGGDLTLQAQDTVKVRDTVATPFLAQSGGNFTVIGNDGIDILALNHPTQTPFVSGGNLSLISDGVISLDAHFQSGGNFSTERLDGSLANLYSPHDPVILANGDVTLGNYEGASLHILAGGSVTLGNVTITGTGDTTTTINPTNTALFNGSRTYADLATVYLTDYKATLNSDGSVRSVDPVLVPITIDGSTRATLDVRAGVDWAALGGLPTNRFLPETLLPPPVSQMATSANITVNGNIRVAQPAGLVLLTNQFSPNTLPGTISIRGNVDTSTTNTGANGGDIRVYGRGDIEVVGSNAPNNLFSIGLYSYSDSGNAGNGGGISFVTNSGNISLDNSGLSSGSYSDSGNAGNGGGISFVTNSGNISLDNSGLSSGSYSDSGNAGNGGGISFATNSGNISLDNSTSYSHSQSLSGWGNAGNGGVISFATNSGNIFLDNSTSYSFSFSLSGNAGNGGGISFATNSGDISLDNSTSYSRSDSSSYSGNAGNGGGISFATNSGNISLDNYSRSLSDSSSYSGNAGNGGGISFATNSGNISLNNYSRSLSYSYSYSGNAGNGGGISFATNSGNISLNNYSRSDSRSLSGWGNAGNGGGISFATNSGNISLDNSTSDSSSRSSSGNAGNGGGISFATNSGNISLDNSNSNSYSSSNSSSGNAGNGGIIHLSARRGTISGSSSVLNSFAVSTLGGSGNGGKVTLEAESRVSGLTINTIASGGNSGYVEVNGFGDLLIYQTNILTAQSVKICISSATCSDNPDYRTTFPFRLINLSSRGQAGNVAVTSTGSLTFSNSVIQSDTRGGNPAGSISITSPGIVSFNNSQITSNTSSTGQAGSITLKAPEIRLDPSSSLSAQTSSSGSAGNLTLQPYDGGQILSILFQEGAQISASTSNQGTGGNLTIEAPNAITIQGQGTITTSTTGDGAAGELRIDTQRLTIADGATISASTFSENPEGTGGSIIINATESFNLSNQASLLAQSTGAAPAGEVEINTPNLTATNGTIATSSELSSGGDITITADKIRLYGDSDITTFVAQGTGGGGDIKLTADSILAFDDSDILAYAPEGTGGNINLKTPAFFGENYRPAPRNTDPRTLDGNNRVDVNATGAVNGVIIEPDVSFIQNSLTELPDNQIDTDSLLANSCIVRRNQPTRGSFTITGSGGLPQRPGDAQMSTFPTVDIETLPSDGTSSTTNPNRPWQKGDPIVEPQGVYRLPNGKLVLSRECS
jgi:filamentous hemagglutinin family protein